jgi:hypothetical protein
VETRFNRPSRNDDNSTLEDDATYLHPVGRPLGRKKQQKIQIGKRKRVSRTTLDENELMQAHRYVLSNHDAVAPFIEYDTNHISLLHLCLQFFTCLIILLFSENTFNFLRDRLDRDDCHNLKSINNIVKNLVTGFEIG